MAGAADEYSLSSSVIPAAAKQETALLAHPAWQVPYAISSNLYGLSSEAKAPVSDRVVMMILFGRIVMIMVMETKDCGVLVCVLV